MGVHWKVETFPLSHKRARELVKACFLLGLCPVSGEFFRLKAADAAGDLVEGDCAHEVSRKAFLGNSEARAVLVMAVRDYGPFFMRSDREFEGAHGLLKAEGPLQ